MLHLRMEKGNGNWCQSSFVVKCHVFIVSNKFIAVLFSKILWSHSQVTFLQRYLSYIFTKISKLHFCQNIHLLQEGCSFGHCQDLPQSGIVIIVVGFSEIAFRDNIHSKSFYPPKNIKQ